MDRASERQHRTHGRRKFSLLCRLEASGRKGMEGAGSRLSRASSRYGPTATVFNGPVRKWKKRWVHVSPPPSTAPANHHKPHFQPNNHSSTLFLCRWTPVASGASAVPDGEDGSGSAEEAPRRKYRYTPVRFSSLSRFYMSMCVWSWGFSVLYCENLILSSGK